MLNDYEIVEYLMRSSWIANEDIKYNDNISCIPELKIMFNAYGDDEELGEGMDMNIECYYMFIHKDCLKKGFVFPEHKLSRGKIIHNPDEIRIPITYNIDEDCWDINFLDTEEDSALNEVEVSNKLQELYKKHPNL